jgi:hypothetical protein
MKNYKKYRFKKILNKITFLLQFMDKSLFEIKKIIMSIKIILLLFKMEMFLQILI